MTEHTAIVATDGRGQVGTIQVPTPEPGPGEVLIKVDYAALIAFDTYITDSIRLSTYLGPRRCRNHYQSRKRREESARRR